VDGFSRSRPRPRETGRLSAYRGAWGGTALSRNGSNRPSGVRAKNSLYNCSTPGLFAERLSSGLKVYAACTLRQVP